MSLRMFACHINFLTKYLVLKLLAIITRFFVGFIKIPALVKISVLRKYISFFFFCFVYNQSGLLTVEFLLKEKMLLGDKIFGYTLRFALFVTAQIVKLRSIQLK